MRKTKKNYRKSYTISPYDVQEKAREILKNVSLPHESEYSRHVYHQFVIRTNERDKLQAYLKQEGISSGIH